MAESPVLNLHNSLRQAKDRWAVFLGAGASYDYGIPTMKEIADILRGLIQANTPKHGITESTLELLRILCPDGGKSPAVCWNIEELLTRLYQVLDAANAAGSVFTPVTTTIGKSEVSGEAICTASDELTQFMAEMCDLSSHQLASHGPGKVDYLADFFLAMASFGKPTNRLIRVFSTNIDLCVEAAIARLSQRTRASRRPDLILVDGFEGSILPTFNMNCFRREHGSFDDHCAIYYWKLHGSVDWTYSQAISGDTTGEGCDGTYGDHSIIIRRVGNELTQQLEECGALSCDKSDPRRRIVIFPTPAKYSQTYTFPYMDMFEAFRRTLEEVELLICVGTSFPDQHIRSAVRSFTERDDALLFVVDPHVKNGTLKKHFGPSRSVQPVISMGFSQFIKEFKVLETAIGAQTLWEGTK